MKLTPEQQVFSDMGMLKHGYSLRFWKLVAMRDAPMGKTTTN